MLAHPFRLGLSSVLVWAAGALGLTSKPLLYTFCKKKCVQGFSVTAQRRQHKPHLIYNIYVCVFEKEVEPSKVELTTVIHGMDYHDKNVG